MIKMTTQVILTSDKWTCELSYGSDGEWYLIFDTGVKEAYNLGDRPERAVKKYMAFIRKLLFDF